MHGCACVFLLCVCLVLLLLHFLCINQFSAYFSLSRSTLKEPVKIIIFYGNFPSFIPFPTPSHLPFHSFDAKICDSIKIYNIFTRFIAYIFHRIVCWQLRQKIMEMYKMQFKILLLHIEAERWGNGDGSNNTTTKGKYIYEEIASCRHLSRNNLFVIKFAVISIFCFSFESERETKDEKWSAIKIIIFCDHHVKVIYLQECLRRQLIRHY